MATISSLAAKGELTEYEPTLGRFEFADRRIYLHPRVVDWAKVELSSLEPINEHDLSPRIQFAAMLKHFITGKPMHVPTQIRRMKPHGNDVWELKSPDIRIFGFFHRKNLFVGLNANSTYTVKLHNLYAGYLGSVARERELFDLDEPKWIQGGIDDVSD